MTGNEKLFQCFSSLETQLFNIENQAAASRPNKEYAIDEIIDGGVFQFNPEDAQDHLNHYIQKVDELAKALPSIIQKLELTEKTINVDNSFPFNSTIITVEQLKSDLLVKTMDELSYYSIQLSNLVDKVINNLELQGIDKFSNAGFKIKLDLNNEEIGSFFNTLYEINVISNKKSDGSVLTKKELADFISKNFSSKIKKGEISSKNLYRNTLSRKFIAAESKVDKVLTKMKNFLSN